MFRRLPLLLAGLVSMHAQTTEGLISGRVVDAISGESVTGAAIEAAGGSAALTSVVHSNETGYFALPLLSPGAYHVRVVAPRYQPQELYGQELTVAGRLDYEFRLRPLSDVWEQGQTRSVFLSRRTVLPFYGPDVDLSRSGAFQATQAAKSSLETTVSAVIDSAEITGTPLNGRDVYALLVAQPGAVADAATARGLGLSFNGQRPSASNFLLDGLENNDYLVTGPLTPVAPEAVGEYRVSTNNFSAEYGRASGYLANAVTRSGGDRWHATAYTYLNNDALNANGFQNNSSGLQRTPLKQFQPGFVAGGPLLSHRWFFSSSFEYLRTHSALDPQTYRLPVAGVTAPSGSLAARLLSQYPAPGAPHGAGPVAAVTLTPPSTLTRYLALPRTDYLARGGRYRLLARASIPRVSQPDFLWSPYPDFTTPLARNSASLALGAILELRPNWTNEARLGLSTDDLRFDRPHPEIPSLSAGDALLPSSPAFYSYRNRTRNLEVVDNLVWIAGRHVVKLGGSVLLRHLDGYLTAGRDGYFGFRNFDAFLHDNPFSFRAALSRTDARQLVSPDYDRGYRLAQSSLFVQDSIKLSARLVLNLGLRYERLGAPVNTGAAKDTVLQLGSGTGLAVQLAGATPVAGGPGDQPLYDHDGRDLAPRAGVSWRLRGNGATVLRASYGIFYDRPFDNLWQNLRNNGVVAPGFQITGTDPVNYLGPSGGLLNSFVSYRFRSYAPEFPGITLYQPGLKNGYAQSWFAGVRHQVTGGLFVEVNALGSLGRRLITTDILNRAYSLLPSQATPTNGVRRFNPAFGDVAYRSNQGLADYNAFTAVVRYRRGRGHLQGAYTLGHSIDNQSEPLAGDFFNLDYTKVNAGASGSGTRISAFSRQFDSRGDRGNSDFDQRQSLVVSAAWELPALARGARWSGLGRNWSVALLGAVRSGFPYSVTVPVVFPPPANGQPLLNIRANLEGSPDAVAGNAPPGGVRLLNAAAFAAPSPGVQGNTGRNAFRGPGLASVDVAIGRSFSFAALREGARVTLRADAFNFLNHANLNNPDALLGSTTFGVARYGRTGFASGFPALAPFNETARQVQLLLRVEF